MLRSNSLSSLPSPIFRRACSNINEHRFSADCGTMFGDRDYYDLSTGREVNNFIENNRIKINDLLDFLENKNSEAENNAQKKDKFNIFQSIKFIPKYTRNQLENVRLEKSKKELVALIKLEYKKYEENFREGGDCEGIDLEKIRLTDLQRMKSILEIFEKIDKKVKEIETRAPLMEVISTLLDSIVPLLGPIIAYTAVSLPWVSTFLFSFVCLHYLLKFFVSFKRTFSYEGDQKDKNDEWITSIRECMPSGQEKLAAQQLKKKLDEGAAEQIKFALALMESSSSVHTSSRPSSPVITRPEWTRRRYHSSPSATFSGKPEGLDNEAPYPLSRPSSRAEYYSPVRRRCASSSSATFSGKQLEVLDNEALYPLSRPSSRAEYYYSPVRRRCASSSSANFAGKQPEGLDNEAPIAQPQPRLQLQLPVDLQWKDFDDAYSVAGPSFSKNDVKNSEGSSVDRPKKRFHSSLTPEQSPRPQDGEAIDQRKFA